MYAGGLGQKEISIAPAPVRRAAAASSRIVKINNYDESYEAAEQPSDHPLGCVETLGCRGVFINASSRGATPVYRKPRDYDRLRWVCFSLPKAGTRVR